MPRAVLSRLLDEYRTAREERFASDVQACPGGAGLLVVGLQQRLLSSIEAFARSLKVHRATVERQWEKGQAAAPSGGEDRRRRGRSCFTRRLTPTTSAATGQPTSSSRPRRTPQIEAVTEAAEAESPAMTLPRGPVAQEQALLDQMQEIAEQIALPAGRQDRGA